MPRVTIPVDPQTARLKSHLAGLRGKRTAKLSTRVRAEHYATQTVGTDRAWMVAVHAEGALTFYPGTTRPREFTPAQWRRLKKRRNRIQGATPVYTAIDEAPLAVPFRTDTIPGRDVVTLEGGI